MAGFGSEDARHRAARISRRRFAASAAGAGLAAAAAGLVGCSSNNKNNSAKSATAAPTSAQNASQGTPAAATRVGTPASAAASRTVTPAALDSTKGKPGGNFIRQFTTIAQTMELVRIVNGNAAALAGYTHSGLLEFRNGRPGNDVNDIAVDPDLAAALPEQPDDQTYIFKLQNANFHNGRAVTSEDAKYSYDAFGSSPQSAYLSQWSWYDHAETPDPKTVIIKTKAPFADGLTSMAARTDAFILAKEHQEGPNVNSSLMGSGPFIFVDSTVPVAARFKKNPDFFQKPYPYFDTIQVLGTSDSAKRIADYVSGQVHLTYRFAEQERDQIKKSRPDAAMWSHESGAYYLVLRADQAPFNDKRVRQALSMAVDRKAIRDAVSEGEHENDQLLSYTVQAWGFRKPAQLGDSAKYWNYDPQAAKQLLAAAGITQPIESQMIHNDESFLGPSFVNVAVLTQAQWKQAGIANMKDVSIPPAQATTTTSVGNFDGTFLSANGLMNNPIFGVPLRSQFFAPPEGVKSPTQNMGHVNDPQVSALVDKQLTQLKIDDRKQTLRQLEDIFADQQYRIVYSSNGNFYFADPSIRNIEIPKWTFGGGHSYTKYWWFEK